MITPPRRTLVVVPIIVGLLAVAAMLAVVDRNDAVVAVPIAMATVVSGFAVVSWGKAADAGAASEVRQHKGPLSSRRRLLLGLGAGAAVTTAGALAAPAARRVGDATDRLRTTSWAAGVRVVDGDGSPIVAADIPDGEFVTVYPEGAVDEVDSQAVLIRESPERYVPDPERPDWVPEGIVIYSKLCTHMACPLGLYQQQTGTLLCPCHQAVFDVLDGGRAIDGPARRALPQLPIEVDGSGHLIARGDFSDAVGTGFWGRP